MIVDSIYKFHALEPNLGYLDINHQLPLNKERITLVKKDILVPQIIDVGLDDDPNHFVKPFHSGETLRWSIKSV